MADTTAVRSERRLDREEGFVRLVSQELAAAYRTAAVLLGDSVEAEDATQDALVRAWQRWDHLREDERAGAWFGRILVNVCRDRLRSRHAIVVRWVGDPTAPDPAARTAERDALWGAFAGLGADQQIVVALRYYLDLPVEAIAERTGVPPGTVKSRLHHALRAMRAAYEAQARATEADR